MTSDHRLILKGKNPRFFWGPQQDKAFHRIKLALLDAPILSSPDPHSPWYVFTDASGSGLGGLLCQKDTSGKFRTIDMISRRFTETERRYTTSEREMLAIVFCLKKWRHYVDNSEIQCFTDHRPLVLLKKTSDPQGRLARWLVDLSALGAKLVFNPGRLNSAADALSRMHEEEQHCPPTFNPVLIPIKDESGTTSSFLFNNDCFAATVDAEQLSLTRIAQEQAKDPFVSILLLALQNKPYKCPSPSVKRFLRKYLPKAMLDADQNLIFINVSNDPLRSFDFKILIPRRLQREVIGLFHSCPASGHFGARKTLAKIYHLYTWPRASKMVSAFVRSCMLCQKQKGPCFRQAGKVLAAPIVHPWYRIALDFKGPLPPSSKGNRYILVASDVMTNWVECFALRSANTKSLVTKLVDEVFCRFGIPHCILSDNAQTFISKVTKGIYSRFRIKPAYTTLYHPASNQAECVNKTLSRLLATFVDKNQRNWDELLPQFAFAMNTSPNSITGFTPAFLNFGRELNAPSNPVLVGAENQPLPVYATNLVSKLRRAIEKANRRRDVHRETVAAKANLKRSDVEFEVSDLVWVKAHYQSSKVNYFAAKLAPSWIGPYRVEEKISPLVYRLRDTRDNSLCKACHHISNLKRYYPEEPII